MISDSLLSCSYVLTLITDGMRSVRAFHFDKAAASVLTTCVSSTYHQEQLVSIVTGSVYVKGARLPKQKKLYNNSRAIQYILTEMSKLKCCLLEKIALDLSVLSLQYDETRW